MAKPTRDTIQNGLNGWDSTINNNFIKMMDGPLPVFLHTGDQTDLEASFPAASHNECMVMVDHTTMGMTLYVVDKDHPSGGAKWVQFSTFDSTPPSTRNTTSSIGDDERFVLSNPAAPITLTLPLASRIPGKTIRIKILASFLVTIASASNIDGAATFTGLTTQYFVFSFYSDGATYHVL